MGVYGGSNGRVLKRAKSRRWMLDKVMQLVTAYEDKEEEVLVV